MVKCIKCRRQVQKNKYYRQKIQCRVSQGSTLGSLLCIMHVNDIANCTHKHILSFADFRNLCLSDCNLDNLLPNANIEVNKLLNWFGANKISSQNKLFNQRNSNNPVNSNSTDKKIIY